VTLHPTIGIHSAWRRWQISLTAVSIALFCAALTRTAFFWGRGAQSSGPAGRLLLQGWRGLPAGYVEWLANPLLIISWMLALGGVRFHSAVTAWLSVCLMLAFLLRPDLKLPGGHPDATIVSYGPGYWLWLASALLMVIATGDGLRIGGPRLPTCCR
jgi:hypothetical protein